MHSKIAAAMQAYGLTPDAITAVEGESNYAQAFRATCGGQAYLVRVRAEWATPDEIRFAHAWGAAVSREVPVPVPLLPPSDVPRIDGRYVDISPYIAHEHANGGIVGPEAWETIGEWVGCLHRAGMPLAGSAPRDIAYGNYPNDRVLTELFEHARSTVPHDSIAYLHRAEEVLARCEACLRPRQPRLPHGVVHGDMHFWNVLYARGRPVAIIDLDFLQYGMLLFDLAYAARWLTCWEEERSGEWRGITQRYVTAYERGRGRPLSSLEKECLPKIHAMQSLLFFLQGVWHAWDQPPNSIGELESAERMLLENRLY